MAKPSAAEKLQERLEAALRKFPAIAVTAVAGDRVLLSAAAGSLSDGSKASAEKTLFMVASITKTMIAVLCLQSVERGELSLDEDVGTYLGFSLRNPSFPEVPITARQLLTHSSSLIDNENALLPGKFRQRGQDYDRPLSDYVRHRLCPDEDGNAYLWGESYPPGKAPYHYSNAGFTLVGHVLEKAVGRDIPSLAKERIFDILGMTRTTFTLKDALALPDSTVAVPHGFGRKPLGHYGVAEWPAAGVRSTARDLAKYLLAFTGSRCPLLSASSVQMMLPPSFTCGLAWWGRDTCYGDSSGDVWTHGGCMDGVRTHIYLWPDKRAGMVILTNGCSFYEDIREALKTAMQETLMASLASNVEAPSVGLRYCIDCGKALSDDDISISSAGTAPRCAECNACYAEEDGNTRWSCEIL